MDPEKKGKVSDHLTLENIFIGLAILLGIIVLINIFTAYSLNNQIKEGKEIADQKSRPARIELAVLKNSKCIDCFDISSIADNLKSMNANITEHSVVEFDSKEGKQLVSKYKIQKVPAAIIRGEIDRLAIQDIEKREDAFVIEALPPYTDAATGKIEGKASLMILKDPSCLKCNELTPLISQIKAAGVVISEERNVTANSAEGQELIKKYNVGFIPTMILSRDASLYPIMQQAWSSIGTTENDGSFVLRGSAQYHALPFINLTTGKLVGIINIAYLSDKSCTECYDAKQHKEILESSFGMKFDKEESLDISDARGKELVAGYSITKVPTVILSGEVGVYPPAQALKQFYTIEKDNSYVFRNTSLVGTYRDLSTSQIVKAPEAVQ
jgi:thiol-disulfide isomerase/thioredoxin